MFDSKFSFFMHCNYIANKGYMYSNVLLKCFHTRDHDMQIRLFNVHARPILEYNYPVWSAHLTKDINVIKQVHKFFTKTYVDSKFALNYRFAIFK